MIEFAQKTQFNFDLAPALVDATSAGAAAYATPALMREKLGDLSRLKYLRAALVGAISLTGADTGTFTVHLKDGVSFDEEVELTITADDIGYFEIPDLDLSEVAGAAGLYIELDVDSNTSAESAQVFAKLTVEHPLIIGGC